MTMPSMVSALRSLFTARARSAIRRSAMKFMRRERFVRSSCTTLPSRNTMMRRAKRATSGSCVTSTTVMPWRFSSWNSAMISRLVFESSAPVGSSPGSAAAR
jgi:hypothetical protein